MKVIVDELRLSSHINYVLTHHGQLYDEMAERLDSDGLLNVFLRNECEQFWPSYGLFDTGLFDGIPEDVKREAVRLVAPVLRDVGVTRLEEGFFRRMFSWLRCVLAI